MRRWRILGVCRTWMSASVIVGRLGITFPDSPDGLPDEYSKMLFETASPLTPAMQALAREYRIKTTDKSRGFVLNADMVLLVQAIDIGTRPSNLR